MKRTLLVLVLAITPSCAGLRALVSSGDEGPPPEAQAAGNTAALVATGLTGNPAVGALAGALVTGVAALFYVKRKKKPTA